MNVNCKGASLKFNEKIYIGCIQCVMVYDNETWQIKVDDVQHLQRGERMMVGWMCGVMLRSRVTSDELPII